MKLWKASTARSTHSRPLISRHRAEPLSAFFLGAGGRLPRRSLRYGFGQQSRLQLAGGQDDEGLSPGMIVGHGQVNVDGVAFRRKGVKPRLRSAGEL